MSSVLKQYKQKRRQPRQQQQQVKKFAQEVRDSGSARSEKNSLAAIKVKESEKDNNNNNYIDSRSRSSSSSSSNSSGGHHQLDKFTPIESISISTNYSKQDQEQPNHPTISTYMKDSPANNYPSIAAKAFNSNSSVEKATPSIFSIVLRKENKLKLKSNISNKKITKPQNMDSTKSSNKLSQAVENKLTTASNGTPTATPVSDNNSPPIDEHSPDLINEKLTSDLKNNIIDNHSSSANTNPTIPTYSSIFNTSYYRAITQQQSKSNHNNLSRYNNGNNQQLLKKQQATDLYSEPSVQSGRLPPTNLTSDNNTRTNKQSNLNNSNGYTDYKDENNFQGSDMDDNDIDENLPLSNSMSKIRNSNNNHHHLPSSKRVSPTESASSPIIGKRSLQITNFDHYHHQQPATQRCNTKLSQSPHTKISLSSADHQRQHLHNQTNQPTSFGSHHHNNNCHHNHFGSSNRKLDWQESGSCIDCDCNNCYLKFKSAMSHDAGCCRGFTTGSQSKGCSKTKSMHMILKSIILILLTLLLLILFIGMIAASHFLPIAFDKLLSATRSFNVTIQG